MLSVEAGQDIEVVSPVKGKRLPVKDRIGIAKSLAGGDRNNRRPLSGWISYLSQCLISVLLVQ